VFEIDRPAPGRQGGADGYNDNVQDQREPFETQQVPAETVRDILVEQDFEFLRVARVLAEPVAAPDIEGVRRDRARCAKCARSAAQPAVRRLPSPSSTSGRRIINVEVAAISSSSGA
jgi:hypothetical protein